MTGNDIITNAKLIYPVDTFLPEANMVGLLNMAREKVNKLMQLSYTEYSFKTVANEWRYYLDRNFYEIHRVTVDIGNSLVIPVERVNEGEFPLRDTFYTHPVIYAFTPMNKITLYPAPDIDYDVYLYGYTQLGFNYTVTNLNYTDVIPDNFLEPISFELARRIAIYDQNYELSGFLTQEFYNHLRINKI